MTIPEVRADNVAPRAVDGNAVGEPRRLAGLALALAAYGAFGRPAPEGLGPAEAAAALGLLLATGIARPAALALGAARPLSTGALAFLWLLWVPTLRGLALGNDPRDLLRDAIPLCFLFLPLLMGPIGARAARWLAAGLAAVGLAFALRWLAGLLPGLGGGAAAAWGDRYLPNGAAVLFAAVWLPLLGLRRCRRGLAGVVPGLALAGLGGVALAVLVMGVHRAAVALAALALAAGLLASARSRPAPASAAVLAALAAAWWARSWGPWGDAASWLLDPFVAKTLSHGGNGRMAEWRAVLDAAAGSWGALLFGTGWGGLIRNPAVGGWWVSYAHGFAGYVLFKTGLTGLCAAAAWLATLVPAALRLARADAALAAAALAPLAVGLTVHTSFKYLCLGLLMVVITHSHGEVDAERRRMR